MRGEQGLRVQQRLLAGQQPVRDGRAGQRLQQVPRRLDPLQGLGGDEPALHHGLPCLRGRWGTYYVNRKGSWGLQCCADPPIYHVAGPPNPTTGGDQGAPVPGPGQHPLARQQGQSVNL